MSTDPMHRALDHFGGNQSAMARALNTTQGRLWYLLKRAKRCPAELVLPIEAATGVSRHQLRPDLYPVDPPSEAQQ